MGARAHAAYAANTAIRDVAAGGTLIRPAITQHLLRGPDRIRPKATEPHDVAERLTKRELDVLRLIAAGYSNREISDALGTVVHHAQLPEGDGSEAGGDDGNRTLQQRRQPEDLGEPNVLAFLIGSVVYAQGRPSTDCR